nr:DUF2490 domain-containing protein [Sphingomonas piscis]
MIAAAACTAQQASAREDSQLWTTASATAELGGNFRLSQELVGRFSDNRNGLYEIESNTLLGYRLNKSVTVWAGYTHDPQYAGGDFTIMERRAREQVTVDNFATVGKGKLSARLRAEQRWREGGDGTGWRVRPYLKYALPLGGGGKTNLNLTSEPFINLNTTSFQAKKGLDRVRNLVAVSTKLNKTVTVEAGYLNQHGFVKDGEDTSDHVAHFAISTSL